MTRCVCCDLPVESCGKAVEDRQRAAAAAERDRLLALPGVFAAMFPGSCTGCGERFGAGEPIKRWSRDAPGVYVGPCCIERPVR